MIPEDKFQRDVWELGGEIGYDNPHTPSYLEYSDESIKDLIHKYIEASVPVDDKYIDTFRAGYFEGQSQYYRGKKYLKEHEDKSFAYIVTEIEVVDDEPIETPIKAFRYEKDAQAYAIGNQQNIAEDSKITDYDVYEVPYVSSWEELK